MTEVKKGDKIKVKYTGTLDDGTVFDSSDIQGCLLEFIVGSGNLLKKFEEAVIGMKIEEEKEFTLQPQDAYGQHNPDYVKEISKEYFPSDEVIEQGMYYVMVLDDGRQMPVRISEVTDDKVTIDMNHPLAGKTLTFKIKIMEINQ